MLGRLLVASVVRAIKEVILVVSKGLWVVVAGRKVVKGTGKIVWLLIR